ncbi:MAG: ATP-dependent helicase, partial [Novipirellula sp. JB048]
MPSFLLPPKVDPHAGQRRYAEWHDQLVDIHDAFPSDIVRTSHLHGARCTVEQLFATGEIHGVVDAAGEKFEVYARADDAEPSTGCTCDDAIGDRFCWHQVKFVDALLDQLESLKSPLTSSILKGEFSRGRADYDRFTTDPEELAIRRLNALLDQEPMLDPEDAPAGDDSLPVIAERRQQRIAWEFGFFEDKFVVTPMLQLQKKRGTGFTKGKKLSLQQVVHDVDLPLSDVDRRVVACIRRHTGDYYYGGRIHFSLNPFDALPWLVDQPHVRLIGESCELVRAPLFLTLLRRQQDSKWGFALTDDQGQPHDTGLICSHDAFLKIDDDNYVMVLSETTSDNVHFMREAIELGQFDDDQLDAVIEKMRPLQKRISLRLPESHAGPILNEPAPLALLLRTRSDGTLDYGIRFRDAAGKLRRAGTDPMVVTVQRDGKPVQVQRIASEEFQRTREITESLDLEIDPQSGFGTIADFAAALDLLERLQSSELDVEVLWDKKSEQPISVLGGLTSKNVRVDITHKRNWFGVTGECDFGDKKVPLKELLDGLSSVTGDAIQGDFIRIGDGGWARISASLRKRLNRLHDATHGDR